MDDSNQVFAQGLSSAGDAWSLGFDGDATDGVTWLRITASNGKTHKGGYGSPSLASDGPVALYTGSADDVPNGAIIRVATNVREAEVTTSDGVTTRVELVQHPVHADALVGALIYPAETQIADVHLDVAITQAQVPPRHPGQSGDDRT